MAKIFIVFYSTYGHVHKLAEAEAVGAREVAGTEAHIFQVPELMPDSAIGERFYEPDDAEAALRERLEEIRRARGRT